MAGHTYLSPVYNVQTGGLWADFDHDGDVDQADFGRLQVCFSGSGEVHPGGFEQADSDADGDVDRDDFNRFQDCVGGANQPPGC